MNIRMVKGEIGEVDRDQIMWSFLGYGKRLGFFFLCDGKSVEDMV